MSNRNNVIVVGQLECSVCLVELAGNDDGRLQQSNKQIERGGGGEGGGYCQLTMGMSVRQYGDNIIQCFFWCET